MSKLSAPYYYKEDGDTYLKRPTLSEQVNPELSGMKYDDFKRCLVVYENYPFGIVQKFRHLGRQA